MRIHPHADAGRGAAMRVNTIAVLAAVVAGLALPTALVPSARSHAHTTAAAGPPARVAVQVDTSRLSAPVPKRFLGLSFEVAAAGELAHFAHVGDLQTLLQSLGGGVLRLGGISADTRAAWADASSLKPSWATQELNYRDLTRLGGLATQTGWDVLLTVGLAHYDPQLAAQEVATAKEALGSSLMGVEIGNEPDAYAAHGLRPASWSTAHYNAEISDYMRSVESLTSAVPLAGPDVSGSSAFQLWAPSEIAAQHPALLTGHHYPLGCRGEVAPTIHNLLSPATRSYEEQSLGRFMALSRTSGIPFRMDETNSVSCGGKAGVSDTFASALWAVNYIAHTMAAGISGINLEGNPTRCTGYSPLCASSSQMVAKGELRAQPEWYALLLTHFLVGDKPMESTLSGALSRNLTVTAFKRPGGGLQFVVVDDDPLSSSGVALKLHVGAGYRDAHVLALKAPSPEALTGVTLAGRAVASDGSWRQPALLPRLSAASGTLSVVVAPSSAALITVAPARR